MKTLKKEIPEKKFKISSPFYRKGLVGLEMNENDTQVLRYLKFLSLEMKLPDLEFVHVVPQKPFIAPLREVYPDPVLTIDPDRKQILGMAIQESVDKVLPRSKFPYFKFNILTGNILEELLEEMENSAADLLILGRSAKDKGHMVTTKNLIRQAEGDILIIPEDTDLKLKNILVPFDFSEHSVYAIKKAFRLRALLNQEVRIFVLNIYQRPGLFSYDMDMVPDQFEAEIEVNHRAGFESFINRHLPGYLEQINPILIQKDRPGISSQILEQILKNDIDLVFMGAQGHSQLSLFLLGSTTEGLINQNPKVPMLIIKNKI